MRAKAVRRRSACNSAVIGLALSACVLAAPEAAIAADSPFIAAAGASGFSKVAVAGEDAANGRVHVTTWTGATMPSGTAVFVRRFASP
jgi:hypothetical protein